jgi:hypothetical protein
MRCGTTPLGSVTLLCGEAGRPGGRMVGARRCSTMEELLGEVR